MAGLIAGERTELPAYQKLRRQRIVDAARSLLRSHDYESIQIRDVAAEANVALGTLYRYFASKEHLYANVVFDWAGPFNAMELSASEGLDTIGTISLRLRRALSAFERRPNFYKAILMLRSSNDPEVSAIMHQLGLMLEEPILSDLSMLPPDEAADMTAMVWCVLMDLVARLLAGDKTMDEALRISERFVHMIGLRLTQLEATTA